MRCPALKRPPSTLHPRARARIPNRNAPFLRYGIARSESGRTLPFDAIVGPARSACAESLSTALIPERTLIMSYWATNPGLDDTYNHPYFARTIASDKIVAAATVNVVPSNGSFVLVSVDDPYGLGFATAAQSAAAERDIASSLVYFKEGDGASIGLALDQVSAATELLRIIVCLVYDGDLPEFMAAAAARGLVGSHYFWIFAEAASSPNLLDLGNLTRGAIRVAQTGEAETPAWDAFVRTFRSLDEDAFNPIVDTEFFDFLGLTDYSVLEEDYFATTRIYDVAAFAFDAVVALGLAKCALLAGGYENDVDGLTAALRNVTFDGASGAVAFDEYGSQKPRESQTLCSGAPEISSRTPPSRPNRTRFPQFVRDQLVLGAS